MPDSKIKSEHITKREMILGYFLGPIGVTLMNGILANYLNVYYTDVIGVAAIWGGVFIGAFPVVCKAIDAFTFVLMGRVVDGTRSRQGKARPWILLSAPVLLVAMVLLFAVPNANEHVRAFWIFLSYNLFYSIGYTAYSTAHTLMVPLSTPITEERNKLSVVSNAQFMLSGTFLAILFPCVLVPFMGVDRSRWFTTILIVTAVCGPLMLMEYFFTKERVTEAARGEQSKEVAKSAEHVTGGKTLSLTEQLKVCLKSKKWILFMVYVLVTQLFNALSSFSIFYYCNWVLGSYNDGYTQAIYYAIGNAPIGLGVFLCMPLCKKLGRRRAMTGGFILATIGCAICLASPSSLPIVLVGQLIKSVGIIPASFMTSALMADALDDVEKKGGIRCDGFSSSIYNIMVTVTSGIALGVFNFGIVFFGYQAPTATLIPVQNAAIRNFFVFGALGAPLVEYVLLALCCHNFDD